MKAVKDGVLRELAAMNGERMNPKHGWSPDREALLKTLWLQGLTAAQIAARLGGVSRNAVIGKRIRLGLPDRASPNVSYGKKRKPKAQSAPFPPKKKSKSVPTMVAAPVRSPRAPLRGPNSVRFIDRNPSQCPMFCSGEEGPEGFVCGEASAFGSWCSACAALIFVPIPKKRVA